MLWISEVVGSNLLFSRIEPAFYILVAEIHRK